MAVESVTFTDTHTTSASSIAADYPGNGSVGEIVAGDRIIAIVSARLTDDTWATKTGWTKIEEAIGVAGGPSCAIFEKDSDADGTEGDTGNLTETFTLSTASVRLAAAIIRLSSQGAVDVSALTDYGSSTTAPVSPDVTPSQSGCLVLRVLGCNLGSGDSVTEPASPTCTLDGFDGLAFGGSAIAVASEDATSSGATGTATWTTTSSNFAPGTIVVLPPAGGSSVIPQIMNLRRQMAG